MKIKILKNVAVFPYNYNFTPLLRYSNIKWENVKLFSPKSWGLTNKDASYADGGNDIGITVSGDFEQALFCDSLLVPEYNEEKQLNQIIYRLVENFKRAQKPIYYLASNSKMFSHEIQEYLSLFLEQATIPTDLEINEHTLQSINTPVIAIAGLHGNINKFDVELALFQELRQRGYNVCAFTEKPFAIFLDLIQYPTFLHDKNSSYVEKILLLNRYIKKIEEEKNPDIILVQIPGGIMPYSDYIINDFGYFANIVFQATMPDFSILCLPCTKINSDYLNMLEQLMFYRFNCPVECFYYSNKGYDVNIHSKSMEFSQLLFGDAEFNERWNDSITPIKATKNIFNFRFHNHKQELANTILSILRDENNE